MGSVQKRVEQQILLSSSFWMPGLSSTSRLRVESGNAIFMGPKGIEEAILLIIELLGNSLHYKAYFLSRINQ